jgi:hypothetical protein
LTSQDGLDISPHRLSIAQAAPVAGPQPSHPRVPPNKGRTLGMRFAPVFLFGSSYLPQIILIVKLTMPMCHRLL